MDLKALDDEILSNTYPNFSSTTFASEIAHGIIKRYLSYLKFIIPGLLGYLFMCVKAWGDYLKEPLTRKIANVDSEGNFTGTFTEEEFIATFYAYSFGALAVLCAFAFLGVWFQSQAIYGRSLSHQEHSLRMWCFMIYLQLIAVGVNAYLWPLERSTIMVLYSIGASVFFVAIVIFKVFAYEIRDVMLDKPRHLRKNTFMIIIAHPRYLSQINIKPLRNDIFSI